MDYFSIRYEFTLAEGQCECFDLQFNAATAELMNPWPQEKPFWTGLEFEQCGHCPFTTETCPHCPAAISLVPVIDRFDRLMSFAQITVRVTGNHRTMIQKTSAQEAVSSLMGLLVAGSSCPLTHFFKPMTRFHLPLASRNETICRIAATYLMAKYFSHDGLSASDLSLDGLSRICDDAARLNDAVIRRVRAATGLHPNGPAPIHLGVFATVTARPAENALAPLESVWEPFLKKIR